jgi:hypothetical protein
MWDPNPRDFMTFEISSESRARSASFNMTPISGLPPRLFWNRQESRKTESATGPGLAEERCGSVAFSALTGDLPCDKHTTLTYGHVPKDFYLEFPEDNHFTCRLGKGEGSRAIEYGPQELGIYRTLC